MKKVVSLIISLILLGSLMACSGNIKKDEPVKPEVKPAASVPENTVKPLSDSKDGKVSDNEVTELKIIENETFAYVDENGNLKMRRFKSNDVSTLISEEKVYTYEFNLKDGLVAYISGRLTKDSSVAIYNLKTKSKRVIENDETQSARAVSWSSNGNYIAVDYGTGPEGSTKIYDVKNSKWIEVIDGLTAGFMWSPDGNAIAIDLPEEVNPPLEFGSGCSVSAAVLLPGKGSIKVIMKGTSDYGVYITKWMDSKNLIIEKVVYSDGAKSRYYSVDISNNAVKEVKKNEIGQIEKATILPDEVESVINSVSPDGKLVLYTFYDNKLSKNKVMLWDIEKQQKTEICIGDAPTWISSK